MGRGQRSKKLAPKVGSPQWGDSKDGTYLFAYAATTPSRFGRESAGSPEHSRGAEDPPTTPIAHQAEAYTIGHVYSHLYGNSVEHKSMHCSRTPPSSGKGKLRGKPARECRSTLVGRDRSFLNQRREQKRRSEREDKYSPQHQLGPALSPSAGGDIGGSTPPRRTERLHAPPSPLALQHTSPTGRQELGEPNGPSGFSFVGSGGLLGDLSLAATARERVLKEVHRALYRRLPSVKGILPPSEAEAWDSLALDESSSDEDEGPVEREGPDSYFCVVFAGGREAHEGFVRHRMKDIKQSLRPCVHQDYLRRTLSSTFQFVSSNGGVLGGASNSETEQSPYSILIPLYPKLVSTTSCAFVDRTPNAHRGGHKVMAFTPTTPRRNPLGVNDQSSTLFSWEMSKGVDTDNFADNDADIEISLARYVSAPLVSDLIRGLDNADDRITSYSTQFLKAIYVSRANMMHRLDLMKQLRECTKERCLRARIFEYFRTNLCDTGHVASKQLLANDTAANESHRDHLNCLLDFVRLCVSVPISSYTFPSTNNNGQDYIGISTIESIKLLFNEFGNVILDCLQTVGSGLGMNASTADGIYCQNHLVTKIVTCLNVMMNTAVMCDQWIRRETCSFSDFSFCLIGCDSSSICRSAILLMLHRMIASWPQSACDSTCLTDVESGSKCSVHPLQFFSFDQQRKFSAQVSKRQMEGFFDSESGTYLAVRVNVSNSVREEAYVTTCYEILCSHVCSALYEAHEYVDEKTKCDQNSAIPNPFQLDNSISYCDQKFDKCVDRILFKILNGVVSDHFKISLKCISCLQERGLQILKRYFLPVPEDVWSFENGDIAQNITESCFSTPCTFKKNCLLCCRYCTKREARLDQLVSNLRLARGKHWNNRVRSSAGELLDLLLDML